MVVLARPGLGIVRVTLAGTNHENGALGVAYDMIRDRTQQHAFSTAATASPDHDDVCILRFCGGRDRISGIPFPEQELRGGTGISGTTCDLHQQGLAFAPSLIDALVRAGPGEAALLEHVDDEQPRLEPAGQLDGTVSRLPRRRGEVSGQEDRSD
jgi:hypothetical protein